MWYAFRTVGWDGFRRRIQHCFETADYAIERLEQIGRHAWRHKNSVTVVFDRPSPAIISKWQLAVYHDVAHIITMPHVTRRLIDRLIDDLIHDAPEREPKGPNP